MPFETSKRVVEAIEKQIFGQSEQMNQAISFLMREVLYPIKFLRKGFDLWYRDFLKFTLLCIFIMLLLFWTFDNIFQVENAIIVVIPIAFFVSMILSMFSAPSSFSFCGVKKDHIQTVVELLTHSEIASVEQIDKVADNISLYEKRVKVRVVSLRGFLGLCWAGVFYLFSISFAQAIKAKSFLLMPDMEFLSFLLFALSVLYVCVESYSKINTLIFRSALLGCNEYYILLSRKNGVTS